MGREREEEEKGGRRKRGIEGGKERDRKRDGETERQSEGAHTCVRVVAQSRVLS